MSVMRDQCNARPTVTFRAARHHRPLAGTKLYCFVTEARVCVCFNNLPRVALDSREARIRTCDLWTQVQRPNHSATEPHRARTMK